VAGPLELAALDLIARVSTKNASELRKINRALGHLKEHLMAQFDQLNEALDQQRAELAAAVARVAEDVQALKDQIATLELDEADQAAVDAATARVTESVETLRGLDPVPAEQPADGDDDAPADGEQPQA
jgi:chromosome segregation ATPase